MWETLANGVVNSCRTKLRKIEDARRALENKFVEAIENLGLRSEEFETSMVEVEVSRFKCLEFKFLAAALQEHVGELEEVAEGHVNRDVGHRMQIRFSTEEKLRKSSMKSLICMQWIPSPPPFVNALGRRALGLSRYFLQSHAAAGLPFSHPP